MAPVVPKVGIAGVVVLEAPTKECVEQNSPLQDRGGLEFREVLDRAGIDVGTLLLLHTVACVPTEPQSDVEMRKAMKACEPLVREKLSKVMPSIPVLAVGKWAAMVVSGKEKAIGSVRGFYDERDLKVTEPKK